MNPACLLAALFLITRSVTPALGNGPSGLQVAYDTGDEGEDRTLEAEQRQRSKLKISLLYLLPCPYL